MSITYTSYPSLLFTSFTKDNAPTELPFVALSPAVHQAFRKSEGFNNLWATMSALNSLGFEPTNYRLNDLQFNNVENEPDFRNLHFKYFNAIQHQTQYGVITFKTGGQYPYLILDQQLTRSLKNQSGNYMATALMIGDNTLGFEEALLTPRGFQVENTGIYTHMDVGGYLSFMSIALAFLKGATKLAPDNKTTEKIYCK